MLTKRSGLAAVLAALYLYNLSRMGMTGPDEPRYAWIARGMAQSGDWLIPRLWGAPWYEKPPLLYWLSGLGFGVGLGEDLAPRLPIALLSLAFLAFFWWRVRTVWDQPTATWAVALLATSAGWLAYSHIAVTDLPLAVFFSAAVLLCCGDRPVPTLAAAALALAVLAKGLVPIVLFTPVLAMNPSRLRSWLRPLPLAVFAVIALPWFAVTAIRSDGEMIRVLFIEQTFVRFASSALQHVQPWWFYGPVALLLMFPWFPLLPLAVRARGRDARTLAAVSVFGVVFFSLALNKLPGYLLPLVPATCVLIAIGSKHTAVPGRWLAASLVFIGLMPALAQIVPGAMAGGLRATPIPWAAVLAELAIAALAALVTAKLQGSRSLVAAVGIAAIGYLWFENEAFSRLDDAASARPLWRASHPVCFAEQPRALAYGMYYYANRHLPPCEQLDPDPQTVVR